ncbi:restriction endonuclease [Arthrobacter psychrolactophilus]
MSVSFRSPHHTREVLVYDWRDAEELAAWYMRETLEMGSVQLTGSGADGGIDVVSSDTTAQVKHYGTPVGAPEVQQAKGASHGSLNVLFFALSGYTKQALDFSLAAGVALFSYDIYGDVSPQNEHARTILASAPRNAARRSENAARLVEQETLKHEKKLKKARKKFRKAVEAFESQVATSEAAIISALGYATDLSVAVGRQESSLGEATQSFILAEYASYFRAKKRESDDPYHETAPRVLEKLNWATTGMLLDFKGSRVRYLSSVVETAAREFLALYNEITDLEKLRSLSISEWSAVLCDWELREAQIESLIDESAITDAEETPSTENLARSVIASLGKSSDVLTPLPSRWPHEVRDRIYRNPHAFSVVAAMNPMAFGVERSTYLLSEFVRRAGGRWDAQSPRYGTMRYPLGSSPKEIEELQETLALLSQQGTTRIATGRNGISPLPDPDRGINSRHGSISNTGAGMAIRPEPRWKQEAL